MSTSWCLPRVVQRGLSRPDSRCRVIRIGGRPPPLRQRSGSGRPGSRYVAAECGGPPRLRPVRSDRNEHRRPSPEVVPSVAGLNHRPGRPPCPSGPSPSAHRETPHSKFHRSQSMLAPHSTSSSVNWTGLDEVLMRSPCSRRPTDPLDGVVVPARHFGYQVLAPRPATDLIATPRSQNPHNSRCR